MTVVHRDVRFSGSSAFDVYVPEAPTAALCVYLHGGGWRVGSRTEGPGAARTWFFERVAELGLAVATVDYRLSTEATYPAQLDDVTAAVNFLARHRADFGISTVRTVAWGVSAGGHLAALAALQPSTVVDRVVCWYPPTDLDALSKDIAETGGRGDRSATSREGQLLGAALDDRPDLVAAASPVNHVRRNAPPFLFLHGDADVTVPPRQSERLAAALRVHGGQATVDLVPGGTHMFPELDGAATLTLVRRSVDFLLQP